MRSQTTAFGVARRRCSPSRSVARTSRNQVFQVASDSCSCNAVVAEPQSWAAAVRRQSGISTAPSTGVENRRTHRNGPSSPPSAFLPVPPPGSVLPPIEAVGDRAGRANVAADPPALKGAVPSSTTVVSGRRWGCPQARDCCARLVREASPGSRAPRRPIGAVVHDPAPPVTHPTMPAAGRLRRVVPLVGAGEGGSRWSASRCEGTRHANTLSRACRPTHEPGTSFARGCGRPLPSRGGHA